MSLRYIAASFMTVLLLSAGCEKELPQVEPPVDEPPVEEPKDSTVTEPADTLEKGPQPKKVSLWISASVNFSRLKTKANIKHFMDKIEESGFNEIIVEVKTSDGAAMYKSDLIPEQTVEGNVVIERDWDYLQYFIDQAHSRGMTILAASTVFPNYREEWEDLRYSHAWCCCP